MFQEFKQVFNGWNKTPIHYEGPRVFNRIPFLSCRMSQVELGYGNVSIVLGVNKSNCWYILLEGPEVKGSGW